MKARRKASKQAHRDQRRHNHQGTSPNGQQRRQQSLNTNPQRQGSSTQVQHEVSKKRHQQHKRRQKNSKRRRQFERNDDFYSHTRFPQSSVADITNAHQPDFNHNDNFYNPSAVSGYKLDRSQNSDYTFRPMFESGRSTGHRTGYNARYGYGQAGGYRNGNRNAANAGLSRNYFYPQDARLYYKETSVPRGRPGPLNDNIQGSPSIMPPRNYQPVFHPQHLPAVLPKVNSPKQYYVHPQQAQVGGKSTAGEQHYSTMPKDDLFRYGYEDYYKEYDYWVPGNATMTLNSATTHQPLMYVNTTSPYLIKGFKVYNNSARSVTYGSAEKSPAVAKFVPASHFIQSYGTSRYNLPSGESNSFSMQRGNQLHSTLSPKHVQHNLNPRAGYSQIPHKSSYHHYTIPKYTDRTKQLRDDKHPISQTLRQPVGQGFGNENMDTTFLQTYDKSSRQPLTEGRSSLFQQTYEQSSRQPPAEGRGNVFHQTYAQSSQQPLAESSSSGLQQTYEQPSRQPLTENSRITSLTSSILSPRHYWRKQSTPSQTHRRSLVHQQRATRGASSSAIHSQSPSPEQINNFQPPHRLHSNTVVPNKAQKYGSLPSISKVHHLKAGDIQAKSNEKRNSRQSQPFGRQGTVQGFRLSLPPEDDNPENSYV